MRKTTLIKALALLLSFAMLMTGLPAPSIAETIATPTDTVIEQSEEIVIEDEQPVEEVPDEPLVPDEETELPPIEDEMATEPEIPMEDDEDATFPEDNPPADDGTGDLPTDDVDSETETEEPSGDEPVTDDEPLEEQPEETLPDEEIEIPDVPTEDAETEIPPVEDEPIVDDFLPEDEPLDEPIVIEHPVKAAIDANGYAYLLAENSFDAYNTPDMSEHIFTVHAGVLLATDFMDEGDWSIIEVQFLTAGGETLTAYAYADDLPDALLERAVLDEIALTTNFALVFVGDGKVAIFQVDGEAPYVEELPPVEIPEEPEVPVEQPTAPDEEELFFEDELPDEQVLADEGAFVLVSTDTRTFLGVDDSAADDYEGDLCLGYFVSDAIVQVESIEQDAPGRNWYLVRYLYGDTHANGQLKWTETDVIYVLADETFSTDGTELTITDFAFPFAPMTFALRATPMNGFSLRDISASLGNFYVGQTGLHGSSGRDSEYLQIATLPGHGKIYATPHYLEGYTVYCLEHLLPGPGERVSGGSNQPTGPYTVVDLASYMNTPGYSGVMYKESTMHAIGWVLRHTVPFMELDRSDSDNRTWSRVAGQFAIREVIKQLEGSQYMRDYWDMDDFYAASNNAPAVYLEYARWLAANGIARASMTGKITVSNKSVAFVNGKTVGTVTLTTDADLIRISKSYGTVSGNTYGSDSSYYYLNSGDTITISSSASSFSFKAEAVSSPREEAGFVVGIPNKPIQKLLIPQSQTPYPIQSITLSFEAPVMGRILLDKKGLQLTEVKITTDAWGNEVHTPVYEEDYLAGAVFEIRAAEDITGKDGTVWYQADELVDTITTTANGSDASKELPLGKYNVMEVSAPEGYFFTDRAYIVDLKYQDNQTALVEFRVNAQNDFLPAEISLFKEKETINIVTSGKDGVKSVLTDEAGEGFVFGLFTAEDMPYAYGTLMADTLVATGATDKNGMLTLIGTFPHGDYYIRELAAPDGWKITADRFDLSITPDRKAADENVLRVLMVDAIHNELIHTKVTLTKTDITGEKTLPGAIIEVYNEAGKIIYRDTTDEMGRITNIPVTPGRYTFREVYAPDGYSLNDVTMSFTVSADGVVTGDTTIRDDYTRFSIEKLDEADEPLAGVEFSLVSSNGVAIMSARTNRNGIATFEKVPFGTYRIVEAKPLAGYLPAEMEVEVTIDGTFINPEHPIATIINVPNEIVIRKVDQDDKPLAGASFGLFDAFGERFAVATSDENGMVRFTKVPYGSYTIRELSAPDGYLASREEITVTIDADYRSSDKPITTVKNHFKRVQFVKVDTSGKYLPGVEFSLINAVTHEVVETAVSNDKGEFIFTEFDYGDWIVRETAAPEGYNRMEDYLLHVDESWTEPKPITLVNIPSTYMFFKSDNKRNALAGATFAVEDENGNVVQEVVSAENGVVYIYDLTPGKYTIRETATVEGFTVSDDTITVEINEKYKVPTKLKRFVNYPSISTGVDVSPTTLTWMGIGLVGIAGLIIALNSVMGGKKHPKRRRK